MTTRENCVRISDCIEAITRTGHLPSDSARVSMDFAIEKRTEQFYIKTDLFILASNFHCILFYLSLVVPGGINCFWWKIIHFSLSRSSSRNFCSRPIWMWQYWSPGKFFALIIAIINYATIFNHATVWHDSNQARVPHLCDISFACKIPKDAQYRKDILQE